MDSKTQGIGARGGVVVEGVVVSLLLSLTPLIPAVAATGSPAAGAAPDSREEVEVEEEGEEVKPRSQRRTK